MAEAVTVAIPVRNGGALLGEVLTAVRAQRLDRDVELLVADSGSTDGSAQLARRYGAEVIDVAPGDFSHGGTRNLLVRHASGSHVALLSQDAVPADPRWLARLLEGFRASSEVALVFGRYRPRVGASVMVRREIDTWFDSLPLEVRGTPDASSLDATRRLFFTDANGCVAKAAWQGVPFREVRYAEDQLLARDMLAAGYAKVYRPEAAVIHSHDYRPMDEMRRSFDEWRGLREVGVAERAPAVREQVLGIQRAVRDDVALARLDQPAAPGVLRPGLASVRYHALRTLGAALGARAERLPPWLTRACSLERRAGFQPITERTR